MKRYVIFSMHVEERINEKVRSNPNLLLTLKRIGLIALGLAGLTVAVLAFQYNDGPHKGGLIGVWSLVSIYFGLTMKAQ